MDRALESAARRSHQAGMVACKNVLLAMALTMPLAACDRAAVAPEQPQRISLDDARRMPAEPLPSPRTSNAAWTVSENGQAIDFGVSGAKPMLTLACALREKPAQFRIVRHVTARPGTKALFPVIGNGTISRFKADATLSEGEWRWEASLAASDPMLDVFTGPNEIEATLPGGGSLLIAGSRIPGEFVTWCRAGGQVKRAEAAEATAEAGSVPPAR